MLGGHTDSEKAAQQQEEQTDNTVDVDDEAVVVATHEVSDRYKPRDLGDLAELPDYCYCIGMMVIKSALV